MAVAVCRISTAACMSMVKQSALRTGRSDQLSNWQAGLTPPPALLIMSSPAERKVSYAELLDFKAVDGVVQPLIDSGLGGPCGIAYHSSSGALYVADPPKRKILRYHILARRCQGSHCKLVHELVVKGVQLVVAQNVLSAWVAVDGAGSLYYTDQETNSVNKIDINVLHRLIARSLRAGDLKFVSEQEVRALAAAGMSQEFGSQAQQRAAVASEAALRASIVSLYQAGGSSHVGMPTGVMSDGGLVYWANQAVGTGSVAVGSASLQTSGDFFAQTFAVSNATDPAYGIAGTRSMILYAGQEMLFGVGKVSGVVSTLSDALTAPRGIVWDGDSTVYIADMGGNAVFSVPCGRPENQPLHHVVDFHGPFGLALLRPAQDLSLRSAGKRSTGRRDWVVMALAACVFALRT